MRKDVATASGDAIRTVVMLLGIVLVTVSTARAHTWEAVCDVGADYALGLENYPEAIRLHEELLTLHPGNALAHYHLGFAYGMIGRGEEEIREYVAAVTLGSNDWDLYLNLGVAYLGQGKIGKSIESLKHGVLIAGEQYELHLDLAIAYERGGRLSEALREVSTALRLNPTDPEVHNLQATVYAELGDLRRARDEWSHLTRTAPDYVAARDNLNLLDEMCDEGPSSSRAPESPQTFLLGETVAVFCDRVRSR
jgi:Flp pilus assembly protein TadD